MPVVLTPSGSQPSQFVAPADGDFVDGASVQQTAQPIIDATDRCRVYTPGARPLFETLHCIPTTVFAGSHFTFDVADGWKQTTTGGTFSGSYWYCPLGPFPRDQSNARLYLTEINWLIKPAGSHAGLPQYMPGFRMFHTNSAGLINPGSEVFIDDSGTLGAYESVHQITGVLATPLALDYPGAAAIYLAAFGEYGTNALTGLRILGAKTVVTADP